MIKERYFGFKTASEDLKKSGNCCGCTWSVIKDSLVHYDDNTKFLCPTCFNLLKRFVENGIV